MRKLNRLSAVLAGACLLASAVTVPALSAGFFTNGVPPAGGVQYPGTIPLTGVETLPADTNLTAGQNPASEAITPLQLSDPHIAAEIPQWDAVVSGIGD